ncbi:hypothetical protein [Methanosarcina sp.]|uniref:hypothetical protein n=1 Tax=Methanosarcina sp. TaxID=2213 RepID=UPI0029886F93|nr:hypothetical protein [Methanosarcina sp.]MDW5550857.1 hypothetical protein [Methanosarcina sp.]MDW5554679.1 hypothetical protein [Methanosarcina sp.]MDW5560466.1 hypothetical protein [Methanosarcina sp.]
MSLDHAAAYSVINFSKSALLSEKGPSSRDWIREVKLFAHKLIRLSELRERNGPVLPRRDSGSETFLLIN